MALIVICLLCEDKCSINQTGNITVSSSLVKILATGYRYCIFRSILCIWLQCYAWYMYHIFDRNNFLAKKIQLSTVFQVIADTKMYMECKKFNCL